MPALVGGEHVQSRGETESNAPDERVREAHAGEIDVRVAAQKCTDAGLRVEKGRQRVVELGRRPRTNRPRGVRLQARAHGRFEIAHEPATDRARFGGTPPGTPRGYDR